MCYATLDTDAIGSCRLPAAVNGVVGFKGTYNLINMQGILEGTEPPDETIILLSHAGITSRSVMDTTLLLDVLSEKDPHASETNYSDSLVKNQKLRIGIASNFKADEEISKVFRNAVEKIQSLGHTTREINVPFWNFSNGVKTIATDRKTISKKFFKDIDLIILPTIPTTTPLIKEAKSDPQSLSAACTVFANYYGLPAITIPYGFDKRELPLGLQIVGKPMEDRVVLRLAYQYESVTKFIYKHPIR